MKTIHVTNAHYGPRQDKWTYDVHKVWVTDQEGRVWELSPQRGGLAVRALGGVGKSNDSIRVEPLCSNEILLRSTEYEDQ